MWARTQGGGAPRQLTPSVWCYFGTQSRVELETVLARGKKRGEIAPKVMLSALIPRCVATYCPFLVPRAPLAAASFSHA
jgi:hypothetical protein